MHVLFHETSEQFPRSEGTVPDTPSVHDEKVVEESDVSIPPLNVHCVPLANLASVQEYLETHLCNETGVSCICARIRLSEVY